MTFSGATGFDQKLSLDEFYGAVKNEKKFSPEVPAEAAGADIPIDMMPADIALETPAPDSQFKPGEQVPLPPVAKPVVYRSHQEVCDTLTEAAEHNNLPVSFFIRLLFQESRFKPEVVSSAGAQGIAQFMPETAASMGLQNPFDPLQAIPASARLLRELIGQFGNLGLAAAAYNAGPKRIQDWLAKKGKLPEETKGYVKTITGSPAEKWTAASAEYPGQRLPRRAPCQEAAGLYAWSGPATIPLPTASPLRMATPAPVLTAAAKPAKKSIPTVVASAKTAHKPKNSKAALEKVAQR